MKYYFKFGYKLIIQSFVAIAWILIICFKPNYTPITNWFIAIGFGYTIVMFLYNGLKPILLAIKHQPLIEFDEVYIHDNMEGVKYKWTEVVQITEDSGALTVKTLIDNSVYSANSPSKYRITYIKLDNVKGDRMQLLMALNDYSIRAAELENISPSE